MAGLIRRRVRPTPRGLGTLGLGLLALAGGAAAAYPGLVALGSAAVGLVLVATVSVLLPAPLAVEHHLEPARTPRLGRAAARLELHNRSSWVPVVVAGTDQVGAQELEVAPVRLLPGERRSVEVPVPTDRRGLLHVGPFTLERRGLADLVRAREALGGRSTLVVTPRALAAAEPPTGRRRGHVGAEERVERGGTDLVGLREYVAGDDLRRLHWATSARTGTLMVREDADPAQPHLTVLLDDRATSHRDDTFEEAVDVAASLVGVCAVAGVPARCVALASDLDLAVPTGAPGTSAPLRAVDEVSDRLTVLVPGDGRSGPPAALPAGGAVDVLAVITGPGAAVDELLVNEMHPASVVLLVVDPQPGRVLGALGPATVVRGPRAEDLLRGWDLVATR
ncbi:DUF58 domain-containing protein [Actinotalea sp. BY-33]|uniref:DUF58 domain-containing protein n=1 Tax=Actinotalea soli TaxID=2819234 RepID=A0A939RUL9_9CELL|nr:DUF58 domain-containing protein [Actinotalea soli]MBO1750788.1 DUF58 domain-containing protein [Actinotalea soli]